MYKGLRRKLPLLLTFCLFTSLLPASGSVFCPAVADERYEDYGRNGNNGTHGQQGRNGRDGESKTVVINGSPINLDLSGAPGEDGEDGEHGYRSSCRQPERNSNRDITAPHGGNGGNGGRGGNGGNGGNITVYYTNLADLQKIFVRANPGDSGRGGRGGRGVAGCRCRRRSWEIETCTGTPGSPDYKCTKKRYRCYNGRDGRDGNDASDGKRGNLGILSIVNSQQNLPEETPSITLPISELASKQLNLSKHKWNLRQGAASLLAPGSIIADEYREFEQRLETAFELVWRERQPITSFGNQAVKVSLNDSKQVEVNFPEDVWVEGSSSSEADLTKFTINHAILKKDVARLAVSEFADAGENLNLKIVDLAAKSDVIETQFRVKFRVKDNISGFLDYQTQYEGDIPAELITRDYNRFILALGKLKIGRENLRPGVNVDIEVVATRSLGERSVKQTINWQGAIRKPIKIEK
ncbi:collagen-like protein [Nostoc sp. UHCC 0870]|uniref:collagen-like protein n=1 Tax=Nostoc sp. UHCC 0870 TaxID=2914041 RepID=UPI001EE05443|nr:collagen-like protein [Nostoc sp. UHCC 0870]UKO98711.1 collagen-like protein [Nostoc sp. UHCC 0870]